jgi:hypothetical protein
MFSAIPQYSLTDPGLKRTRKTWGKQKSRFNSYRRLYGGTFGIVLAHSGKNPVGVKHNMQPLIPLKLPKCTNETLFTTQLICTSVSI